MKEFSAKELVDGLAARADEIKAAKSTRMQIQGVRAEMEDICRSRVSASLLDQNVAREYKRAIEKSGFAAFRSGGLPSQLASMERALQDLKTSSTADARVTAAIHPAPPVAGPIASAATFKSKPATSTTSTPVMALEKLRAVHALCLGENETRAIEENRKDWSYGVAEYEAANAAVDEARQHGPFSPALKKAENARAELRVRLDAEKAGTDEQKAIRLAQSLLSAGIVVPGVATTGLQFDVSCEHRLPENELKVAESMVVQFLAATADAPDTAALTQNSPAAQAAREFLKSEKRIDQSGRLTLNK